MCVFSGKQNGFTCIELILVCCIIGVLTVFFISACRQLPASIEKNLYGISAGDQNDLLADSSEEWDFYRSALLGIASNLESNKNPSEEFSTDNAPNTSPFGEIAVTISFTDKATGKSKTMTCNFDENGNLVSKEK